MVDAACPTVFPYQRDYSAAGARRPVTLDSSIRRKRYNTRIWLEKQGGGGGGGGGGAIGARDRPNSCSPSSGGELNILIAAAPLGQNDLLNCMSAVRARG